MGLVQPFPQLNDWRKIHPNVFYFKYRAQKASIKRQHLEKHKWTGRLCVWRLVNTLAGAVNLKIKQWGTEKTDSEQAYPLIQLGPQPTHSTLFLLPCFSSLSSFTLRAGAGESSGHAKVVCWLLAGWLVFNEPWALGMLGEHSATELYPQPR